MQHPYHDWLWYIDKALYPIPQLRERLLHLEAIISTSHPWRWEDVDSHQKPHLLWCAILVQYEFHITNSALLLHL